MDSEVHSLQFPYVPGICDEIPFPLAKRVTELSSPGSSVPFLSICRQTITVFPAKLSSGKTYRHNVKERKSAHF